MGQLIAAWVVHDLGHLHQSVFERLLDQLYYAGEKDAYYRVVAGTVAREPLESAETISSPDYS